MIREHDSVVLTADVPQHALITGDVGTVVHVYAGAKGMEVEFMALDGETVAVVTLLASQVRPVGKREMPHARPLAAV